MLDQRAFELERADPVIGAFEDIVGAPDMVIGAVSEQEIPRQTKAVAGINVLGTGEGEVEGEAIWVYRLNGAKAGFRVKSCFAST